MNNACLRIGQTLFFVAGPALPESNYLFSTGSIPDEIKNLTNAF